jgi:hypothetical protein
MSLNYLQQTKMLKQKGGGTGTLMERSLFEQMFAVHYLLFRTVLPGIILIRALASSKEKENATSQTNCRVNTKDLSGFKYLVNKN